jgi:hypothetical protein
MSTTIKSCAFAKKGTKDNGFLKQNLNYSYRNLGILNGGAITRHYQQVQKLF